MGKQGRLVHEKKRTMGRRLEHPVNKVTCVEAALPEVQESDSRHTAEDRLRMGKDKVGMGQERPKHTGNASDSQGSLTQRGADQRE